MDDIKQYVATLIQKTRISFNILVLKRREFCYQHSLILTSEPRGGSTWLMELLSRIPRTAVAWEPLHVEEGVVPRTMQWGWRPYLPEDSQHETHKQLMMDILAMKRANSWVLGETSPLQLALAERVLTKFVRANRLLPWLTKQFSFTHPPIYLLRHPIAVAQSQMRAFGTTKVLKDITIPEVIHNEAYCDHLPYINALADPLEKQVALWCLHNSEVINHPRHDQDWVAIYYEHLVMNPQAEITRLSERLGVDIPYQSFDFHARSKTDFQGDLAPDRSRQLTKWQDSLSQVAKERIQRIFDHFEIKLYSAYELMPTTGLNLST